MTRWIVLVGLVVGLAGCEGRRTHKTPAAKEPTGTGIQGSPQSAGEEKANLSDQDREFFNKAAIDGVAEVRVSELATRQGSNEAVKEFGRHLIDDHGNVNQQLKQLAEKKGIQLPDNLDQEHRNKIEQMSNMSGREFDRNFTDAQIQDHQKALELFQREAREGQDPDVKNFAAGIVPSLQEHLRMAKDLQRRLSTGGATTEPSSEGGGNAATAPS